MMMILRQMQPLHYSSFVDAPLKRATHQNKKIIIIHARTVRRRKMSTSSEVLLVVEKNVDHNDIKKNYGEH